MFIINKYFIENFLLISKLESVGVIIDFLNWNNWKEKGIWILKKTKYFVCFYIIKINLFLKIVLKFFVRCPNYYQVSNDQKRYIKEMEYQREQNIMQIEEY